MTSKLYRGKIEKVDAEKRQVFGWAYVAVEKSGAEVEDHSGDVMLPETLSDDERSAALAQLEDVVYDYVLESRDGGEMHVAKGVARLIESIVFTPEKIEKMGLSADAVPIGWWVGFHIDDDTVWGRVQKGELTMFSIGGAGIREDLEHEERIAA